MRAFSYFMLANLYGKPYHPATANEDLCVPLNKEIGLSDKMMKRATNAAVYAQMEEDINKAIQCFKAIGGEKTIFRPNLPSAYLLASRIALFRRNMMRPFFIVTRSLRSRLSHFTNFRKKKDHYFFSLANKEILLSYGLTSLETHMKEDFRYTGNLVVSDDLLALIFGR